MQAQIMNTGDCMSYYLQYLQKWYLHFVGLSGSVAYRTIFSLPKRINSTAMISETTLCA